MEASRAPSRGSERIIRLYEHRRHRFHRLRLPDVVPGEVHRALPAGTHVPRQSEFSRRYDGQAPWRVRAEHRLHAGAARRDAAADGNGRAGLRRLPPLARSGRRRHLAGRPGGGQVHGLLLLQHRRRGQPDRLVLHRRDGQCRRVVVPYGPRLPAGHRVAQRSGGDDPVRRRNAAHCRSLTSGTRVSSARACPARSWPRASRARPS